ncbi:MAG TPA: hypothetical protein VKI19_14270 [Acidimicrobiales bacterium]|nr:hypothetical protein [Acidimicrobiales bacterium]
MIDSTASPVPAWKRYATMVVLVALVLAAGYMIYTKEIKKSGGNPAPSNATPTVTVPAVAPPTTVPGVPQGPIGGIPISSRNPFSES